MQANTNTEALIIGAGPIGLFQAFELGLLGIDCHIIEALDQAGGQCTELYPDKPIYDIPGTAYTVASALIDQLLEQLKPFNTPIHLNQTVRSIIKTDDDFFIATTNKGNTFKAKHLFLATGAGAFTAVKMRLEGIEQYEGTQLHYTDTDVKNIAGKNVVVVGDNNSAVSTALNACEHAKHVIFVHRKRRLDASTENLAALQQCVSEGNIQQIKGKITAYQGTPELQQISIKESSTVTEKYAVDQILVRLGNSPKQSDLESWGISTTAKHVTVDTANYESKLENVFAVGDINIYPAKRKLILCGFHEATLAAFASTARMRPDKPLHLQYTTTSTELHKRLGIT